MAKVVGAFRRRAGAIHGRDARRGRDGTTRSRFTTLLPVALALGLLLGGFGSDLNVLPAGATTVGASSVSFSGSSMVAGATNTTWTIGFTASSTGMLNAGGTITVVFAPGFVIPEFPAITLPAGFTGCTGSPVASGETFGTTVTITLGTGCTLANNATGGVTIAGITNPSIAGTYSAADFSVKTSADNTAPVSPLSGVVITGALDVTFSGSPQAAGATNTTWTIGLLVATALTSGSTITVTFAPGFVIPGSPTVMFPTGFTGCTTTPGTTFGTSVTITLGAGCTLASETPATLTIAGITNPPVAEVIPNTSFSVAADVSGDTAGAPAGNVSITGTSASDVTFSGSSTLADVTNTTWTIGFTSSNVGPLGPTSTITVTFAPGFVIPVTFPTVTLVSGFTGCTTTPAATGETVGNTVTITLGAGCTLGIDTHATLTIAGITNPPIGTYVNTLFTVWTTADRTPVSPLLDVFIGDGAGTMTVSPTSVGVSSIGDTLTFTYTAATGGTSDGEITIDVPVGFSTPSVISTASGYTTSTCGTVLTSGNLIEIVDVNLVGGASCTITYGADGPGATAPSVAAAYPFVTQEESTNDNDLTDLATSPQVDVGTPSAIQIAGFNAIGTSIQTSITEFPTPGSAGAVVLARDDFFSDALAGGPLAAAVHGPLLLTEGADESASLDPATQAEIERVLPLGGTVYVLGGDLALSSNIDTTLTSLGYVVVREAGADEFATAVDIANQLATTSWGTPTTVFEATGLSFYDALSAVPAAIEEHAAILLTDGATESISTFFYLLQHPGDTRYAIGGSLAAGGADTSATDIAGFDLFGTSAAVAATFFPNPAVFGAASAADFPDALGGGVFMATGGRMGPLLLVNPTTPLPAEITPYLATLGVGTQLFVFGGSLAVTPGVVAALQAAVG